MHEIKRKLQQQSGNRHCMNRRDDSRHRAVNSLLIMDECVWVIFRLSMSITYSLLISRRIALHEMSCSLNKGIDDINKYEKAGENMFSAAKCSS